MDFDHRDRSKKKAHVSKLRHWSDATLLREMEKCDVVCANCHRIRTHRNHDERPLITEENNRQTELLFEMDSAKER